MSATLKKKKKVRFRCPEPVTSRQQLKKSEHGQAEEGEHSSGSQFVTQIMFEEIKVCCRTAQGCFSCTVHMLMLYLPLFCCNVCLAASKHMKT